MNPFANSTSNERQRWTSLELQPVIALRRYRIAYGRAGAQNSLYAENPAYALKTQPEQSIAPAMPSEVLGNHTLQAIEQAEQQAEIAQTVEEMNLERLRQKVREA